MNTPRPLQADVLLRHSAFVRGVARSLLRDEQQVDDVVQETWLAAVRRPPRRGNLRGWLARVARNLALRLRRGEGRRARHERAVSHEPPPEPPPDVLARLEVQRGVVEAVMALDEPYRSTVVQHFFDGLAPKEIARRDKIPVQTVRTRLRRARARLREHLDQTHGGARRRWMLALLPLLFPRPAVALPTRSLAAGGIVAVVVLLVVVFAGLDGGGRRAPRRADPSHGAELAGAAADAAPTDGVPRTSPSTDAALFEGLWNVRMNRPEWHPRVVTGTVHLARGEEGWSGRLTFHELNSWSAVPVDVVVSAEEIRLTPQHPYLRLEMNGAPTGRLLKGTCEWDDSAFTWEARRASVRRFEPGLRFDAALPKGEADGAAIDALVRAAELADTEALVVLADGHVVCERYFGRARDPVQLMSVTNLFSTLAILCLIDEGKIASLDAPLATWFPEWSAGRKARITLRHVLLNTTGLEHLPLAHRLNDAPDRVAFARRSRVVSEPGEVFDFNNRALALVSGVIRAAAGRPADEVLDRRLFRPLGIRRWTWPRDKAQNPATYADLHLGARDLAKVGQLLLQDGLWEGRRVLPAGILELAMRPGPRRTVSLLGWLRYDDASAPVVQTDASLQAFPFTHKAALAPLTGRSFATGAEYRRAALELVEPVDAQAGQLLWRLDVGYAPYESEAKPRVLYRSGELGQHFAVYPEERFVVVRLRRGERKIEDTDAQMRTDLRPVYGLVDWALEGKEE